MKLYVIFWVSLALCTLSATTLTSMNSKDIREHNDFDKVRDGRVVIALSTFVGALYVLASSLELLMLYAYYRMSMKLSEKAAKLVVKSLCDEDVKP